MTSIKLTTEFPDIPDSIFIAVYADNTTIMKPTTIIAYVEANHVGVNDATVTGRVSGPICSMPIVFGDGINGYYTAYFTPMVPGQYAVNVTAEKNGLAPGHGATNFSAL